MTRSLRCRIAVAVLASVVLAAPGASQTSKPRARDLGVPFDGTPGPLNAITDVAGVEVGHATLIRGSGPTVVGQGPVRTGVTAIWPRGQDTPDPVFGAWFSLNGDGEMTGTTWLEDRGLMEAPLMITNTLSVGIVHHAVIRFGAAKSGAVQGPGSSAWLNSIPIVAETWDGTLNDILGQHVTEDDALEAMGTATGGPVAEGNVGGGTGMICHRFKGGIGTSSRLVEVGEAAYTLGVLVQCNYGSRDLLRIAGVPVGHEIPDLLPSRPGVNGTLGPGPDAADPDRDGSIIVVVATDAPLLPHQLKRVARRISLGLARNGSISSNGSGDIFAVFSTANREGARTRGEAARLEMLPNGQLNPFFRATVEATEEAVVNAMVAAETMTGADDVTVYALPHDRLRAALRRYNRLVE